MVKSKSASVNLTIEEFTAENLALALYGTSVIGSTGTVTDEPIGGGSPVIGGARFSNASSGTATTTPKS